MRISIIFRILILSGIIGSLFPMFRGWTNIPLYYPSIGILFLFTLIFYPKALISKSFLILTIVTSYLALSNFRFLYDFFFINAILPLYFVVIVIEYFYYSNDKKGLKIIAVTSLIIVVIRIISGIYVENRFPNSARDITGNKNPEMIPELLKIGVANYGLCAGLIFIFTAFVYYFKQQVKIYRKFYIIILVCAALYLIYYTAFSTSLLFSLVAIAGCFMMTENIKKSLIIMSVLLLLVFFTPIDDVINYSIGFSRNLVSESEILSTKVDEVEYYLVNDEATGDIETRFSLYKLSLDTWLQHPILGSGKVDSVGGHSSWLDWLGMYGLFGFVLLVSFFWIIFKKLLSIIPEKAKGYFMICILLYTIFGFMKGSIGGEIYFSLLIITPSLFYLDYIKKQVA